MFLKKLLTILGLLSLMLGMAFAFHVPQTSAYVGEVWDTESVYYAPAGRGGEAEYVIYPARSGHIRFWFRNIYNSGDWVSRDMPILTCLGSVPCWGNVWAQSVGPNYKPDHADLISNDYYSGQGGYVKDAGYFYHPNNLATAGLHPNGELEWCEDCPGIVVPLFLPTSFGAQWCDTCVD